MIETPGDMVEKVVELLDQNGWCQDAYHLPTGERCIVGAFANARYNVEIGLADVDRVIYDEALMGVAQGIRAKFLGDGEGVIMGWNDTYGRTYQEVRDLLVGVAKKFRDSGR